METIKRVAGVNIGRDFSVGRQNVVIFEEFEDFGTI
jgi:hypothetical protein